MLFTYLLIKYVVRPRTYLRRRQSLSPKVCITFNARFLRAQAAGFAAGEFWAVAEHENIVAWTDSLTSDILTFVVTSYDIDDIIPYDTIFFYMCPKADYWPA